MPDDEAVEKADEDPRDGLQRVDLASGLLDSRVVVLLAWLGEWHTLAVTALRSDHSYLTKAGVVSNHAHGRAVDVGAVDGELMCRNTGRSGSVSSWATSRAARACCSATVLLRPRVACPGRRAAGGGREAVGRFRSGTGSSALRQAVRRRKHRARANAGQEAAY